MCGICGFISKNTITVEQLKKMNDTMYHRGPNDSGEEIYPIGKNYLLGLAQRRLSVLDLSALGHQPMHSINGRISVVFNGEIYNFNELKEELGDYPFCSECDTEVIIAAYLKWGIKCIDKFNGMFAIALYDREKEALYLVRDRIGKKPLYYWIENENIVFASELKPIMSCPGFAKKIRTDVMKQFMHQQYIQAPNSIYENVFKLEPGEILEFDKGNINKWKYWDVTETYNKMQKEQVTDYCEAKEELKKRLKKAVKQRMIADVPLGAFLSGGYDSSLITAIAQELSESPIKTFSIGFYDSKYNEAAYAREVANYIGTNHTELYISEKEMAELVQSIPTYFDEPFADSSQIPTMLVSKLAREQVTVALSGDGGDEFFCGYNIYQILRAAQMLDLPGALVYKLCQLPPLKQLRILERLPFKIQGIAENRDAATKTQIGGGNYIREIERMLPDAGGSCKFSLEEKYNEKNWQIRRMLLDMDTYLSGDILCKVDRAAMKYSLEARCPILDVSVMEYSYRIPHQFKYFKGDKKHILKDIAYDYIPKEMLERPKVGFSVPLDSWLRGPLKEQLIDMTSKDYLKNQGIFEPDYTNQFSKWYLEHGDKGARTGENFSKIMWSFYVFQKWYQRFQN